MEYNSISLYSIINFSVRHSQRWRIFTMHNRFFRYNKGMQPHFDLSDTIKKRRTVFMKRVMMQVYLSDAAAAIAVYQKAFDAKLLDIFHTEDGRIFHSELDVYGQVLSVADREISEGQEDVTGNIMQFCLHFGQGNDELVKKAYEALYEGGTVRVPLGPCMYSSLMCDMIDRFGVRWCIFV